MLLQSLAYLFRMAVRLFYYFKTTKWQRTTAFVTGQIIVDPAWGFPSVKLHYRFDSNGSSIKGSDLLPCHFGTDAKGYAKSFRHNHPVTIRVNPKNSQETRLFERDQKDHGVPESVSGIDKEPNRKRPFPWWQVSGIALVILWGLYCIRHRDCFPCQLFRVIVR